MAKVENNINCERIAAIKNRLNARYQQADMLQDIAYMNAALKIPGLISGEKFAYMNASAVPSVFGAGFGTASPASGSGGICVC